MCVFAVLFPQKHLIQSVLYRQKLGSEITQFVKSAGYECFVAIPIGQNSVYTAQGKQPTLTDLYYVKSVTQKGSGSVEIDFILHLNKPRQSLEIVCWMC